MAKLLETIHGPQDIKSLTAEQLNQLADEMRELITVSVSRTGGHLASNLGVVELTIALHYVFDLSLNHSSDPRKPLGTSNAFSCLKKKK